MRGFRNVLNIRVRLHGYLALAGDLHAGGESTLGPRGVSTGGMTVDGSRRMTYVPVGAGV